MNDSSLNPSGLNSLSGFSFQIKVFIYQLTKLRQNQCVEFETLDDVAVQSIPKENRIEDSCLKLHIYNNTTTQLFQVKQTNVTASVGRQVLYNWLIAYNKYSSIDEYVLLIAQGYRCSGTLFTGTGDKEYTYMMKTDAKSPSLAHQVKQIYEGEKEKFLADYKTVCSKVKIVVLVNIDDLIKLELENQFHSAAPEIGSVYFSQRVTELFNIVCARIMESAAKRIPYICTYPEYMQLCDEICRHISPEQYSPDYSAFKQVSSSHGIIDAVKESREYQQLAYCKLPLSDIEEHIRWEQFYQNIRHHYLIDARKEAIVKTENIAHNNHKDVVLELKADDKDMPIRRLIKTKQCQISTLQDEFSRWGAYIYLTQEGADNQISWRDEDENNHE